MLFEEGPRDTTIELLEESCGGGSDDEPKRPSLGRTRPREHHFSSAILALAPASAHTQMIIGKLAIVETTHFRSVRWSRPQHDFL